MLSITSGQFDALLATYLWPFARILGMMIAGPIFGETSAPLTLRIGLALAVAVAVGPLVAIPDGIAPASPAGLLVLVQQLIIGLALGFTMRLVLDAAEVAGSFMGLQMGLGFATFFDPRSASQTAITAQFFGLMATLVFLSVDGHLLLLDALVQSFQDLPVGPRPLATAGFMGIARFGGSLFYFAMVLSLPVVATMLVTNLMLGVVTRAAPQLNVFAIGFPITLAVGFAVVGLALPVLGPVLLDMIRDGLATVAQVARSLR